MKRSIAQYHLPGLFEFYELYKVFLPLFREHREYFYDWCDIGSVYGAPADCIWGGGRAGFGDDDAGKVLDLMKEYGISARLTFSNSLLREEHLLDKKCNALCKLFEEAGDTRSESVSDSNMQNKSIKVGEKGSKFFKNTCKGKKCYFIRCEYFQSLILKYCRKPVSAKALTDYFRIRQIGIFDNNGRIRQYKKNRKRYLVLKISDLKEDAKRS